MNPKDRHLDIPSEANRDKHINFLALENNGQDPADVLEKLLSSDVDDARSSQTLISEEDLKLRPDFGGLSLKELAESDTELDEATQRASSRPSNAQDCACSLYTCRNRSVG